MEIPAFDENDTVFYQLPEDTEMGNNPIYEVNMELRAEEHSKAINDDLNFLSFKCGLVRKDTDLTAEALQPPHRLLVIILICTEALKNMR